MQGYVKMEVTSKPWEQNPNESTVSISTDIEIEDLDGTGALMLIATLMQGLSIEPEYFAEVAARAAVLLRESQESQELTH